MADVALRGRDESWALTRELSKSRRRQMTDVLQAFVEYVDPQGGASSQKTPRVYAVNATRAVNKAFGITELQKRCKEARLATRDHLDEARLAYIGAAEVTIANLYLSGMQSKKLRSEIKDDVRRHIEKLGELFEDLSAEINRAQEMLNDA